MIRLDMTNEEYEALLFILGYKVGQQYKKGEEKTMALKSLQLGVQLIGKAQKIGELPINKERK
jgi:hypothetical protein